MTGALHRREPGPGRQRRPGHRDIGPCPPAGTMIWTAVRNMDQGALVASMYELAASVPCDREAIMVGGLRGA